MPGKGQAPAGTGSRDHLQGQRVLSDGLPQRRVQEGSVRGEERRIQQAELALLETADPRIDGQVDSIRAVDDVFHRRVAHWRPLVAEAVELVQLQANVRRWGAGYLSPQERTEVPRDRLAEGVIPGKREQTEEQQRAADRRRLAELLARGRERLEQLQARRALHQQAQRETSMAEAKLAENDQRIRELLASKRRPDSMRWVP